ncbi:MAG: bestrophin family protein [Bacteroidota bacterium]
MHAGRHYSIKEILFWTRRDIIVITILSTLPAVLYDVFNIQWLNIPWLPIALIGTAVAFIIGFKNNATYSRTWEARQIWGSIVNGSRTWGIMAKDFVSNNHAKTPVSVEELKQIQQWLIYRHIAWITALRFQLRQPRKWENLSVNYNAEYRNLYSIPELENKLEDELAKLLPAEEIKLIISKQNPAAQLITLQSEVLGKLNTAGLLDDLRHVEMQNMLKDFFEQQGKCERIKNFPYPRQFATLNLYFVRLFIILVPFGMLKEFEKIGENYIWLTIPFSALVCWVFNTMEKIGEVTENPFEGTANDVPISAISRTIEIDLREMLGETDLPPKIEPVHDILM